MINNYYIIIPKSHQFYAQITNAAEALQELNAPEWTTLSIVEGTTEALVKIPGASLTWYNDLPGNGSIQWLGQQGDAEADAARFAWQAANFPDE